jgi:ribosomal protein S21
MVFVQKSKTETPESMWRKFGKINYEESLVDELRERKYHKKPSIIKKEMLKHRPSRKRKDGAIPRTRISRSKARQMKMSSSRHR